MYRIGVRFRGLDRGRRGDGLLLRSVNGDGTSLEMGDECRISNSIESSVFTVGRGTVMAAVLMLFE